MKIILFNIIAACYLLSFDGSLHDFSVPLIEGGNRSLSVYSDKKVMIVTLPLQQTANTDSMLYSLDTLAAARANELKVVAVPSIEDGFTVGQKNELLQWYRSKLDTSIIITDGLYTHKSSGIQQHPLFVWLTHDAENGVFDVDANSPGFKYICNNSGKLYAVLNTHTKMHGSLVQKVLNAQ